MNGISRRYQEQDPFLARVWIGLIQPLNTLRTKPHFPIKKIRKYVVGHEIIVVKGFVGELNEVSAFKPWLPCVLPVSLPRFEDKRKIRRRPLPTMAEKCHLHLKHRPPETILHFQHTPPPGLKTSRRILEGSFRRLPNFWSANVSHGNRRDQTAIPICYTHTLPSHQELHNVYSVTHGRRARNLCNKLSTPSRTSPLQSGSLMERAWWQANPKI